MRAPRAAEVALSLGVLALGLGVAGVTATLAVRGRLRRHRAEFHARRWSPPASSLLGVWLAVEAFTGGWRDGADDRERSEHAFNAAAFCWVTAGLFAHMALIAWAGFVIAGTVLFACVARGFGSRRLARDLAIGLVLALGVYLFFVKLLNVNLPAGWLAAAARRRRASEWKSSTH